MQKPNIFLKCPFYLGWYPNTLLLHRYFFRVGIRFCPNVYESEISTPQMGQCPPTAWCPPQWLSTPLQVHITVHRPHGQSHGFLSTPFYTQLFAMSPPISCLTQVYTYHFTTFNTTTNLNYVVLLKSGKYDFSLNLLQQLAAITLYHLQ